MKITLHYGAGEVEINIPDARIARAIRPREGQGSSQSDPVGAAIERAGDEFADIIQGKTVGVLLPDGTRDMPLEVIWPRLFGLLKGAKKVLFYICTGTHSADTPENEAIARTIHLSAAQFGLRPFEVVIHDCRGAELINAGVTSRGTEVVFNARMEEPQVFCVLSDVKPHYFAGYSNPVKYFVPGLCPFETAEQNHSWTMDDRSRAGIHPWHPDAALRDNPLAADQLEAMEGILKGRPVWSLVTLSSAGRFQWADFGPVKEVTQRAITQADANNCFTVEPVRKMIVSPGGLPNDVDLYIAQRALELTETAVSDGGEVLFVSACPKGVGSTRTREQFYDKLVQPLETIRDFSRSEYRLFSHKPLRFARLIRRLKKLWMYSGIPDSEIQKMHMVPSGCPQDVVDGWLRQSADEKILVVDGANKLLLRPNG